MNKLRFATCINCIDGRTQEPVIKFLKRRLSVDFIDTITEPGPDKILAQYRRKPAIASIKHRVRISIKKHHSQAIAVVGHYDCAGNPVTISEHLKEIEASVENIHQWGFGVPVIGLWINKEFQVERVMFKENP